MHEVGMPNTSVTAACQAARDQQTAQRHHVGPEPVGIERKIRFQWAAPPDVAEDRDGAAPFALRYDPALRCGGLTNLP